MDEKKPRTWWVLPEDPPVRPEPIIINCPPDVWFNPITTQRIFAGYWKDFVKVVEVIPEKLDVSLD